MGDRAAAAAGEAALYLRFHVMLSGPEAIAPLLKTGFPCQQLGRSSPSSVAAGGFPPLPSRAG